MSKPIKCPKCGHEHKSLKVCKYLETQMFYRVGRGYTVGFQDEDSPEYISEVLCENCGADLRRLVPGQQLVEEPWVRKLVDACQSLVEQAVDMLWVCEIEAQDSPSHYEAIEQACTALAEIKVKGE